MALVKSQTTIGSPSTGSSPKQTLSFPTSPDAYSFGKVDNLPIDYFKGQANIDIPVYTIQIDNVNIPVSLKYNTGGIKQNEIASSVGLGWSLSVPNRIMKSIEGMDDESSNLYFKDFQQADNYFSTSLHDLSDPASDLFYNNLADGKPDLYNYSLPTTSGSFIVNNNKGYTIPHEDIKITKGSSSIVIVDNEGNTFTLSAKNSVTSRRQGSMIEMSSNLYLLDNIQTNRNSIINFEYNKNQTYKEKTRYETKYLLNKVVVPWYVYEDGQVMVEDPPAVENIENNWERLISKITFPDGEINFLYSGDQNETTTADSQFRKDLNSNTGAVALKRIIVKNKAGATVKDVSFIYGYFESASTNKTYADYRLRLDRIKNNLDNSFYEFTYNEEYAMPARNSNSDDYWGYFNSTMTSNTSIPRNVGDISSYLPIGYIPTGRERNANSVYAQMGILKKIKYPTGAERKLQYESHFTVSSSLNQVTSFGDELYLSNNYIDATGPLDPTLFYQINQAEHTYTAAYLQGKMNAKFIIGFSNGCYNGVGPDNSFPPIGLDPDYDGPVGSCRLNWNVEGTNFYGAKTTNSQFEIPASPSTVKFRLQRTDKCGCTAVVRLRYNETVTNTTTVPVGGLRIKEIEDTDNSNVSNKRKFSYSQGALKRKFHFIDYFYRVMRPDPSLDLSGSDNIIENLKISSSGNSYIGYNSTDIVTYSKVTEYNDLGEVDHFFTNAPEENTSIFAKNSDDYNDWKFGLPVKTVFRKGTDTLKVQINQYDFNPVKNTLSGYTSLQPESIAFSADYDLVKFHSFHGNTGAVGALQIINYDPVQILGAKVELKKSKTTEYFAGGKKIETVTDNAFSDSDANKPINLASTTITFPDQSFSKTNYSYAHDQGNQLMIDRNMIGIPLETTVMQTIGETTKTLGKTKTIYPTSLPTAQTGNLVLPTSVLSYDLQNPTLAATEVTYNKYDSKGNIQQYTTKDGISTAIIWGYNNTHPIAKIVGATYAQVSSLATAIISASDTDASAAPGNDETAILTALDNFRKDSSMAGYQITTYTYDPLVGVRSITPPSGIREVYLYDTANRLMEIREGSQTGKILKEFKYNYKN